MLIGFFTLIKVDPIVFSIRNENYFEAIELIKKVYPGSDNPEEVLEQLRGEVSSPVVNNISFSEAVFGPDFILGTTILTIFTTLTQLTGYNILNMFSVRIFASMNELAPSDERFPANEATQIIGVCGFLAVITSFFVTQRFGRKTILVGG